EGDLQLAQVFSGANSWAVTKTEMEDLFRAATLSRQVFPAFRNEVECRIARERNAPVILVPVRVPDIEEYMCAFWDQQSVAIGSLDPGVGRRPARQEIERRRQA